MYKGAHLLLFSFFLFFDLDVLNFAGVVMGVEVPEVPSSVPLAIGTLAAAAPMRSEVACGTTGMGVPGIEWPDIKAAGTGLKGVLPPMAAAGPGTITGAPDSSS